MRIIGALGVMLALATPAAADEPPRAHGGVQLGGANVALMAGRVRALDHVYVEGGVAMVPHFTVMASLGVLLEQDLGKRWSMHLAAGASGLLDVSEYACVRADGPDCFDRFDARFVYARIGISIRWLVDTVKSPSETRLRRLALDVGLWRGEAFYRANDRVRDRDGFATPMAGLTYLFL